MIKYQPNRCAGLQAQKIIFNGHTMFNSNIFNGLEIRGFEISGFEIRGLEIRGNQSM